MPTSIRLSGGAGAATARHAALALASCQRWPKLAGCTTKGLFGNIGSMREYRRGASTGNQERRQMARTKPWELSEEVWERAQPLLPERKPHPRGGRPPRDDRTMLGAIFSALRQGLHWIALAHEI